MHLLIIGFSGMPICVVKVISSKKANTDVVGIGFAVIVFLYWIILY